MAREIGVLFMHVNELRRDQRFPVFCGVLALLMPLMIGCGGGKGAVSGTVTLDGKPLPAGTIGFRPSKGTPVVGTIKDGQSSVSGVPSGNVKVTVETASIKEQADGLLQVNKQYAMSRSQMRLPPDAKMPPEAKEHLEKDQKKAEESSKKATELLAAYRPLPDKYSKPETSGLSLEVKSGPNTLDVPLSSK